MKTFFQIVSGLFLLAILSACGGGGGSAGGSGSGVALFTSAASAINILPGEVHTYTIGGGVPSYSATSSNTALKVSVSDKTLTIAAVGSGTATVTVTDNAGGKVSISVTMGTGVILSTTAGSSINVGLNASSVYTIIGGVGPYLAASSNNSVANVSVNGNQLTVTGAAVGKATIVVSDYNSQKVNIDVQVGSSSALFTSAPKDITVAVNGTTAAFTIGGGSQVYSVASSNSQVATVGINGNIFVITGVKSGTTVVSVTDSLGASVSINVTVVSSGGSSTLYTTAPSSITIGTASYTYQVSGGSAPYVAKSSNELVVITNIIGNTLSINGIAPGSAKVLITDSNGGTLTIDVTVGGSTSALYTTAPSSVTVAIREAASYALSGGVAPYSVSSSANSIATVTFNPATNQFTITGVAAGSANIALTDSAGKSITIAVTVNSSAGVSLYTTAPSAVTIATGVTVPYSIGGGVAPYTVTSSNIAVATVSPSTGTTSSAFSIVVSVPGVAKVTITDSVGKSVEISVTVSPKANVTLAVLPNSATGSVGDVLTFQVSGGTPSYVVTSNNPSVATVSAPSGSGAFVVTLVNAGSTIVTVSDATGQITSVTIAVNQNSSLLRLSPSALIVGEDLTQAIDVQIYGGTGPYKAFTSDLTLSSVSVLNKTLTVGVGTNASRCINPVDASGKYIVNGIYDITLTIVDSFGASATSIMTIKDNGRGLTASGC